MQSNAISSKAAIEDGAPTWFNVVNGRCGREFRWFRMKIEQFGVPSLCEWKEGER